MDLQSILIFGGLSVAAYFAGKLAIKGDNAVEERRRQAGKLAGWCEANGLPIISSGLLAYSIGDYSGALFAIRQAVDTIGDQVASKAVLDRFLQLQLDQRLASTDERAKILEYVQKKMNVVFTATPVQEPAK